MIIMIRLFPRKTSCTASKKVILLSFLMLCTITLVVGSMIATVYGGGPAGTLWVDGVEVAKQYDVYPGTTHTIQVCDLPDDIGDSGSVEIKVSDSDVWMVKSVSDHCTEVFEWTAPDAPYCTTYVVQFKDTDGDPPGTFIAQGSVFNTGHLHIIPEIPFGTISTIFAMLLGLGTIFIFSKPSTTKNITNCNSS